MKKKLFRLMLTLMLIMSLFLVTAVTASAAEGPAETAATFAGPHGGGNDWRPGGGNDWYPGGGNDNDHDGDHDWYPDGGNDNDHDGDHNWYPGWNPGWPSNGCQNGHDMNVVDTKEATCTEAGYTTSKCSRCSYSTTETQAALGHNKVYHNAKAPTCTESGWDKYVTCTRCDYSTYAEKAALGHDKVSHNAKAPTCSTKGWDAFETCKRCDYTTYEEKAALGHAEYTHRVQHPTCTTNGKDVVKCYRCGYTTDKVVDALGHDVVSHDAQTPTCTESGHDAYETCKRCRYSTYKPVAPLGHDRVVLDTKEATCTEAGYTTYKCSRCDHSTQKDTAALGHDVVSHNAKAPTCTESGWDKYVTCKRCDFTTYVEKAALGHAEVTHKFIAPTCTHNGGYEVFCTRPYCGYKTYKVVDALGHDVVSHNAKAPTCTENGWNAFETCSRYFCWYSTFVAIPATGHNYVPEETTAPTCTAAGVKTYTCACGDSYTEDIDATGHNLTEHDAKAPTCTEIGWDAYETCDRCDYSTYAEKGALGHDKDSHEAKAPTCTESGWDAYETCNRCDYTTYVGKDALGHDKVSHDAKDPTCTEIGWGAYETCNRCSYTTYAEKAASGHKYEADVTAPTCTDKGYTTHTCACGDSYTNNEVAAKGHTAGEAVVENEVAADCENAGSYDNVIYCTVCENELSRTPATENALGHDIVSHDAKAPTCTEIGWDAYETCSRCDYTTYVEKAVIDHTSSDWIVRTEAKIGVPGEKYKECTVCHVVLETAVIPALTKSNTTTNVTVPVSNDENSVDVNAAISGKDATIKPLNKEQIDQIVGDENASGDVVVDLTELGKSIDTVGIPKESLEAIVEAAENADNDTEHLIIQLSTATLKLDDATMRAIVDQADGDTIKFNFDDVGLSRLNEAQKDAIDDMDVRKGYDAYITVNGKRISDFKGGNVEIIVPYAVPDGENIAGFSVWYIDEDGNLEKQKSTYDGTNKCFVVSHFSDYIIVYNEEDANVANCTKDDTCPIHSFTDTDKQAWYHDGVHYAIANKLMIGVSDNQFAPKGTVTRAQIVTTLWRMAGSPVVDEEESFNDVSEGAWYYDAIRWASANHIVEGYTVDSFGPNDAITREQMAVIMWRYCNYKGVDVSVGEETNILSYEDATAISSWAMDAMQWACGAGMIQGIEENGTMQLNPKGAAVRSQSATMIYRFCTEIIAH